MKVRPLRRLIWWLLPLVLARSLVPGGFMLAADEHGLRIVMCSGTGPVPAYQAQSASHAHAGHHADPAQQDSTRDESSDNVPCLYALAGSAFTAVAWATPALPASPAQKFAFHLDSTRSAEPFLPDRIRGPPLA